MTETGLIKAFKTLIKINEVLDIAAFLPDEKRAVFMAIKKDVSLINTFRKILEANLKEGVTREQLKTAFIEGLSIKV